MIDKRVSSPAAALVDVPDGAPVMIGGFGTAGLPDELVEALIDQGARDLTIVNNNAGKQPVALRPGGCFFHHADSFAMMRGGHLDICVLGAFQVAGNGDLANWHTGAPDAIPAVGGAMDLAIGARQTWVMMEHCSKAGEPKIVPACSYPLTGLACVRRVYTELAVIELDPGGARVRDRCPGLAMAALQAATGIPLRG